MKNIIHLKIIIMMFLILIVSGCNTSIKKNDSKVSVPNIQELKMLSGDEHTISTEKRKEIENQIYPERWIGAKNLHVFASSLVKCDEKYEINSNDRSLCYNQVFIDELPVCERPNEQNLNPIEFENIVKNCTYKTLTGFSKEGLGGAGFSVYSLHNDELIFYPDYGGGAWFSSTDTDVPETVCKESLFDKYNDNYYYSFGSLVTSRPDGLSTGEIYGMIKGLETGLINRSNQEYNFIGVHCGDQPHCKTMYDTLGWSDGKNYFAKGYMRYKDGSFSQDYYVINGKLYNPGGSKLKEDTHRLNRVPDASPRIFGGIENNTIKMYKMLGIQPNTDTAITLENGWGGTPTTYTLKTCEIDL